ncbi:MAG: hypothetical protein ABTD50_07905 [Polyangiaceae bacterium]
MIHRYSAWSFVVLSALSTTSVAMADSDANTLDGSRSLDSSATSADASEAVDGDASGVLVNAPYADDGEAASTDASVTGDDGGAEDAFSSDVALTDGQGDADDGQVDANNTQVAEAGVDAAAAPASPGDIDLASDDCSYAAHPRQSLPFLGPWGAFLALALVRRRARHR